MYQNCAQGIYNIPVIALEYTISLENARHFDQTSMC